MIARLCGTLVEASPEVPSLIVLDVAGVGYELLVSRTTLSDLPVQGSSGVTLYVRMRVTENAVTLYGFSGKEERIVFDKLISIVKVGPALALKILSSFSPKQLAAVVAAQDVNMLTSVPGVGKKSATRLLPELLDLFAKDAELKMLMQAAPLPIGAVALTAADAGQGSAVVAQARQALLGMGLTPQEADVVFEGLPQDATFEEAVRYGLKRVGGGL